MIKNQKLKKYFVMILASSALLFMAAPVFAAEIFYDFEIKEIKVGTEFEIGIFLNTEKENINALEGIVRFPAELLEFKKIRDGNSIINFWIERPRERQGTGDKEQGEVVFSGITPGGYTGTKGLLFSLVFQAKKEGQGTLGIQQAKALLNDGQGTQTQLRVSDFQFSISEQIPGSLSLVPGLKDTEPPESFMPEIASDPDAFEGKRFLVFATQDKGSGISYYEVKETRQRILVFSKWVEAESPYILQDQELRSYVFVKAIDKDGNARIEKISPKNPLRWYENYENWIIVIVGLAAAYAFRKFLWKKYIRA